MTWRLLTLFKPYWGWMLLGILLSLITLLANVTLMAISGWFITSMALAGAAGVTMNYFTPAAIIRACAIVRTGGRYGERLLTHEATFRLLAELRVWFYQKLEPLAPAVLAQYRSGDVLSRIRADIDTLDQFYLRLVLPLCVALLASFLFIVFLAFYHPLLALIELTLLFFAGVLMPWWVSKHSQHSGQAIIETSANLRATLVNDLQGMDELLVYGAANRHADQIQMLSQTLAKQQGQRNRVNSISQAAVLFFAHLALWLIAITAIPLVSEGIILPAELAMLALFVLASFEAVLPLPQAFQVWHEIAAAAERIFSLSDSKPLVSEPEQPLMLPKRLDFRFEQVSFRYEASASWVLDTIDLELKAGQKVAIIGATGSGKSTLTHLLLRFRDCSEGQILLAGKPLTRYHSEALREQIAVVSQQAHVFNTTIRENLKLANTTASDEALIAACKIACIHEFIQAQPEGYNTFVGEVGVRLSGGQLQRLTIARAVLKDAPILILDEPTEGIDPETEQQLMLNLFDWAEGRTVLLISHRQSGLKAMDAIFMLKRSKLIIQNN